MAARGRPLPRHPARTDNGRPGEIYNIGGGNDRTNRAITERLLDLTGLGPEMIRHVADREAHDLRYAIDDSKIREELAMRRSPASTRDWPPQRSGTATTRAGGSPPSTEPKVRRAEDRGVPANGKE
ncbi:hypothetical protein [Streptomyces sp. KL116D]|uniref:hypothetical protein n=1 Tax=Streptomyces sp. KL116D TaxID=3045152 RepID=UPI00355808D3